MIGQKFNLTAAKKFFVILAISVVFVSIMVNLNFFTFPPNQLSVKINVCPKKICDNEMKV